MLAIKGIYDGEKIVPLEKFPVSKQYKVIIAFIEEIDEDTAPRDFASQTDVLSFWHDEREELYQDYLSKKHKRQ